MISTTPGIKKLTKNGTAINLNNIDSPKTLFLDLNELSTRNTREDDILQRALEARIWIQQESKKRRNHDRRHIITEKSAKFEIFGGVHLSWGEDGSDFDEYYGPVNSKNEPHGTGVKFYSDGSVYCGCWKDGVQHNTDNTIGYWISSQQTEYSGTWLCGMKHGKGTQSYPDGSVFTGEFAKGYEHGVGRKRLPDGTFFEGKYRFGRRDGAGVFSNAKGVVLERGVYRDVTCFEDSYPPVIQEITSLIIPNIDTESDNFGNLGGQSTENITITQYYEPPSLMSYVLSQISKFMQPIILKNGESKIRIKPYSVSVKTANHLKHRLCVNYIQNMNIKGNKEFRDFIMRTNYGFNTPETVVCSGVKMDLVDIEILSCIQGSNKKLKSLTLSLNKLNSNSITALFRHLAGNMWPILRNLDLSMNSLDLIAVKNMMHGKKSKKNSSSCSYFIFLSRLL